MSVKYDPRGAGLYFAGFPKDVRKFYWIMAQEGCHPKAAHRILNRIAVNGHDKLTVTSILNFDWIFEQLILIGVAASFISPLDNWKAKYKDGEWNTKDLPERFK